ncbi:hypothetical protein [Niveibacterium terrae]|uniref:hypothetical protein n=1 Tax=Niveibacterium terrae TaxID=3373598 RepID=UPI003A8DB775
MIVALLSAGLVLSLRTQLEQRQLAETRYALEEAREALLGFAAVNGRLPCPAKGGGPGEGEEGERDSAGCTKGRGLLPWQSLGLRALDGWNHRLAYQMTPGFGVPGLASGAQRGLAAEGNVQIRDGAGRAQASAGAVAAAIWSLGANARFATSPDGAALRDEGASADEARNSPLSAPGVLIAKPEVARPGEEFDDQMIWISRYVLFGRMISSGRLP